MEIAHVLVPLELDDGAAGVVRDREGHMWLSYSLERVSGTGLDDYQPRHQGLEGDRTLIGGRLPPGAVIAEVVDDAGERHLAAAANEAWIAVLDQPIEGPSAPVCCRDRNGVPVAPPLPADWARSPVLDADEPCPACGGTLWDEVRATDDSRGLSGPTTNHSMEPAPFVDYEGYEPTPFVVCRSCGHEESIGSMMRFESSDDEDPAEVEGRVQAMHEQMRRENRETLAQVHFPIYAADGWDAGMAGSGQHNGRVDRVTVAHGARADEPGPSLEIETQVSEKLHFSDYALARRRLFGWLHGDPAELPSEGSDAALIVAWRALDRERRKLVANASRRECTIVVDAQPRRFTLLESGARWAAVHAGRELTITMAGKEIDPTTLRLRPIADPLDELF